MPSNKSATDPGKLDRIVAEARRNREQREKSYREQALKIYPWICGRCAREFTRANAQMLTVHHRDHNHDNNPSDGSNWELLCIYCHDNEHSRYLDQAGRGEAAAGGERESPATYRPFAALESLLKGKKQ
ncbi:MAG: YajD family HNH nuclease [Burkholderiales bacterium]